MSKIVCGIDCEVSDPLLKTAGYSWKYNEGYVLNTALYFEEEDRIEVIAGTHNKNCPFCEEDRILQNRKIMGLLMNPDVILVGANIIYDLGWLLYEYGLSTYDVQCSFIDVLQAESILDEFGIHTLESVSWKYLKYGKTKDRIEAWVKEHISAKGDFRQHLKDAPWELLEEYVKGDAKNPVKVWRKQLTLLKEQDLVKRCKLEFDCILPSLQMTMYGLPIDVEQKKKNLAFLTEAIEKLHKEFLDKYKLPNFRVTATRDIASFCDMRNIPYNHKITLTGMNGAKFRNGEETDRAYNKAKRIVASFCLVKGKPTAYVPKELAERTADLLTENGFMFNNSPNVDKKFFESKREAFPEIGLIADWKLAVGIQSKILGEKYDRFLTKNFNGEDCIKPQFKITDTVSFRYSSNSPNCIAEDTLLLTPQGYKPLYCLKEGDSIYNGNGDLTVIKHIWYKGKRNCLSLVSANGAELVCTPEHKQWNGKDWIKAEELNETDIIEKRTDCLSLSKNVDNTSDSRSVKSLPRNCRKGAERRTLSRRENVSSNTAQGAYCTGIYRPSFCEKVCRRIYFRSTTSLQRFMYQVQGFLKQRKELFKEISYKRAESRATQSESSASKVQTKWSFWKTLCKLQRRMFRQERIYNSSYKQPRFSEEKFNAQSSNSSSTGDFSRSSAKRISGTPYRPQSLKQQLGQLGSMYAISSYKVTSTACGVRRVYDIEVESEDHSFIANGFRTKNCQQVPSKGGFTLHDGDKETEISFPKITRALFKASKGCVFGKIDYGQIEYRLICNIACGKSGEEVREQYRKNPHLDFHQYVVDLTGLSRKYAKNMSFGCFSKDSLWLTNTGWVRYNKVTEENVLDCNGLKQKNKNFIFKDKGLKFTLSNGVQFTVNKEHLFFDCEKAERYKCTKKASEMKVGDRVPVTLLRAEGVSTMSKYHAYLAGLYVGDGCGCKSSVELLAHCENTDYVTQCLAESNFSFSSRKEGKVVRFCVHKEARTFFRAFGTRTGNKHIIDSIFRGTREIRLSFLAGLLDSDGTVKTDSIRFMGTNEKLLHEVALLCSTLGFDCGFNVCNRSKDGKPTEYTLLVYNTNGEVIPSVFRKPYFKQAETDVRGWKLDRQGEVLKEKRANRKLYKEEPQLYEYLIRNKRNCFVHNSFMPSDCWQRDFLPAEIVSIEEVEEADFVYLNTSSGEYNAMGIATHNCAFGMGLPSMAKNFGWTMEHAEEIAEAYHSKMPFVAPTLALVGDVAKERGYIKTVYGSHARLHDKKKAYTMLNRYTQGSGGECLKCSIVQAYKEGVWRTLKVANTVHDELNMPYLEPTEEKMIALYRMAEIMRTSIPTLRIPLEAEIELGDNWASTKEIKDWIELRENNDSEWLNASAELKQAVGICEKLIKEGRVQSA